MSAELGAHDSISGHVRSATKEHKLSASKKQKDALKQVTGAARAATKNVFKKESPADTPPPARERNLYFTAGRGVEGEVVENQPINRGRALEDNGPQRVYSERVSPSPTSLPGSRRALPAPRERVESSGPLAITPPGPTASASAAARAKQSAKGSKNTSTIKVAERMVDLEEGPNFGKSVYSITDVPRQWKNNV